MEKYFGNAYRGDPGVLHAGPDGFVNIWIGSALFSALTWSNPYLWQLSNQFNWHDHAMMFEHYHWKKARAKNQPYEFQIGYFGWYLPESKQLFMRFALFLSHRSCYK